MSSRRFSPPIPSAPSTRELVEALLTKDLGVPPLAVAPEAALQDLRVDSLALEELRYLAEERFNINLCGAPLSPRNTIADLAALIEARLIEARLIEEQVSSA